MQDGQVADRVRGVTARSKGAKPPGGGKRADTKTVRVQFHLEERTVERLGVHCSLVGRDRSKVAEEILSGWLARFGKGREIFTDPVAGGVSGVESGSFIKCPVGDKT